MSAYSADALLVAHTIERWRGHHCAAHGASGAPLRCAHCALDLLLDWCDFTEPEGGGPKEAPQ